MTDRHPGRAPEESRFRKGRSGNPNGRLKRETTPARSSAFNIIVDRTLTITRNGVPQEVGVEEAVQHRTYQGGIYGNRAARRDVLKMIAKRELALAKIAPAPAIDIRRRTEQDPENANAALLILGIACEDTREFGPNDEYHRLQLEPWAVRMALGRRRGGATLTGKQVAEIRRWTRDPETLRWPRSTRR